MRSATRASPILVTKFVGIVEGTKIVTTNVPKGANRASAAKRTAKHAQRTPLPPRPGTVKDARDAFAEAVRISDTAEYAEDLEAIAPILDPALVAKAAEALTEWVGHNAETDRREERTAKAATMAVAVSSGDPRSQAKAEAFAAAAAKSGWKTTIDNGVLSPVTELTATRGPEQIVQAWLNGVWQYDASIYAFADRTTKPRNAAGAGRLLERTPDAAKAEMAKVETNKSFRRREPTEIRPMTLPFEVDTATDEEVSKFLRGQTVKWYNRFRRVPEVAMVGRQTKIYLTYYEGAPIVNWCCPVTGFRSCRLDAILGLGRGRILSAETGEIVLEEVAA
jgi:hypothetical protein